MYYPDEVREAFRSGRFHLPLHFRLGITSGRRGEGRRAVDRHDLIHRLNHDLRRETNVERYCAAHDLARHVGEYGAISGTFSLLFVLKVSVNGVAPFRLIKAEVPGRSTCHCKVGTGVPLAAAVNVTDLPASRPFAAFGLQGDLGRTVDAQGRGLCNRLPGLVGEDSPVLVVVLGLRWS